MRFLHKTEMFREDIRSLDNSVILRAKKAVYKIQIKPELGKPLKNEFAGFFSEHFGNFRIIYRYDEENIYLVRCTKRKEAYI